MVLPAKIFEVKEKTDIETLAKRLTGFHIEEQYETNSTGTVNLVTQVTDVKQEAEMLQGVFCRDYMGRRFYQRKMTETPVTEEAPFWFKIFKERIFLIVMAPSVARGVKKLLTGHVANSLSEILFHKVGFIVEVRITNDTLKELHESNPQATKLIWFDDIDIPSVEKLCLAGSGLADTGLYRDYLKHGNIWYVVFEAKKRGITVGVTRNCVVTLFSKTTVDDFIKYLTEDIFGLIK
jgi:hypothetical protein